MYDRFVPASTVDRSPRDRAGGYDYDYDNGHDYGHWNQDHSGAETMQS
jgi:hypothetical protein